MSSSSLPPIFSLEIPDMTVTTWREVVRRARARSFEISNQRLRVLENNADWPRLHSFECDHFYSAWVAMAFRFRACADHHRNFAAVFQRTRGASQDMNLLYQEDDALFGFFMKGLSALESFYYSLYALGALISTPIQTPGVPPSDRFPWLDPNEPKKLRKITPEGTRDTFKKSFPGQPITEHLERLIDDPHYQAWCDIRNVLAHRAATAGRIVYLGPLKDGPSFSVTPWAFDIPLDAMMTASRYDWLRETINSGVEETAAFAEQQLPYTEDQLRQLAW